MAPSSNLLHVLFYLSQYLINAQSLNHYRSLLAKPTLPPSKSPSLRPTTSSPTTPYATIYTDSMSDSSAWSTQSGSADFTNTAYCITAPCLKLYPSAYVQQTISTVGWSSIKIMTDYETRVSGSGYLTTDCCWVKWKISTGDWTGNNFACGYKNRVNALIGSPSSDYDARTTFEIRFESSDTHVCYFDNLQIIGIPYDGPPSIVAVRFYYSPMTSSSGWSSSGSVSFGYDWLSSYCSSDGSCLSVGSDSYTQRTVSTVGYEYIKIVLGSVYPSSTSGSMCCYIQWRTSAVDWINKKNIACGYTPKTNVEFTTDLEGVADYDNEATFQIRLGSNGNDIYCYFDDLSVYGIPLPTSDPTKKPTVSPSTVTTSPIAAPSKHPSPSPTNIPSLTPIVHPTVTL